MPNPVERFFRAMILYAGLFWIVIGLWGVPSAWVMWTLWQNQGQFLRGNELYFAMTLLLICGSRPIVGLMCVTWFRKLADRQYRKIPGLAEMPEPKWHDTAVFTTLLATGTGLYCLNVFFSSLTGLQNPLTLIGMSRGDITGIAVLDVWYYYWQDILISVASLAFAIVFLTQSDKIVARVTRMIDTTPPPVDILSDESTAEGGDDDQRTD